MDKKQIAYYQDYDIPSSLTNKKLLQIIDFYLFNCPVPGTSVRGKKFKDYGFEGSKSFGVLKAKMLSSATQSLNENYIPCKKEELEASFERISKVSPPDEYCVFLKHEERTIMNSLFSAIRNSFAHGSFNVKNYNGVRIYFFVNYKEYKKAQIVLQEDTLLAWIQTIQLGYPELSS